MNIQALLISFAFIALGEFGDKTQLTALTLSVKYPAASVFAGAASAYFLLSIFAVSVGSLLFNLIDPFYIKIISSILFIGFGIYTIINAKEEDEEEITKSNKSGFFSAFTLILLTELGDKTQILTIALAARYKAPIEVFFGAFFGLSLITLIGVTAGKTLMRYVKNVVLLHRIAGGLFIALGVGSFFL